MYVNTVAGKVAVADLGQTLMHEHLVAAMPGWQTDTLEQGSEFREIVAACVDRVEELKAAGFDTMVDPCPIDLGRDVDLMGEVAARTGFNLICITGFYTPELGGAHWRLRHAFDPDHFQEDISALFIRELTVGIADKGVRAGRIKVASGDGHESYERAIMKAAAVAALETGASILTHTNGILGDEQADILIGHGVPPSRILVGHSCGNSDHQYNMRILEKGAYLGFDRFGMECLRSDEGRIESLLRIRAERGLNQMIVSHEVPFVSVHFPSNGRCAPIF